eukprot:Phypoly_transcript_12194.p1 GENE.Phypoly_transcript_12194~~Phypoly_transcript_12194.p1  ORF type:complete len:338 (-),score=44.58 Phypoly_transcript_12194:144-1109(-)
MRLPGGGWWCGWVVVVLVANFCCAFSVPTVNPWIVSQRLALYDTLLEVTKYTPLFNESNEGNILWGLPLQFTWQNESGRLMVNSATGQIFGKSWWACMNYYLSVVPYLGAMKAGVVNATIILPPTDNDASKFCLTPSDCNATLITKWATYFTTIRAVQLGQRTMTIDDLMGVLWDAHTTSIEYAMKTFTAELAYLASGQEKKFGVGWGHFVGIIAAARFVTNATEVRTLQQDLPYRMLQAHDIPGFIPDFSKNMNTACEAMFTIYDTYGTIAYTAFESVWDSEMKNPSCRADAQVMINNFFNSPVAQVLQLFAEFILLCPK